MMAGKWYFILGWIISLTNSLFSQTLIETVMLMKRTCHKITVPASVPISINMTSQQYMHNAWNALKHKDFSCLMRMKWQNESVNFMVIFCAVFTQALMSRSSRWVHIQTHWRHTVMISTSIWPTTHEACYQNQNQNLSIEENIFLVEYDLTMTQQICQSRHVKHVFKYLSTWHANRTWKILLQARLQLSTLKLWK